MCNNIMKRLTVYALLAVSYTKLLQGLLNTYLSLKSLLYNFFLFYYFFFALLTKHTFLFIQEKHKTLYTHLGGSNTLKKNMLHSARMLMRSRSYIIIHKMNKITKIINFFFFFFRNNHAFIQFLVFNANLWMAHIFQGTHTEAKKLFAVLCI